MIKRGVALLAALALAAVVAAGASARQTTQSDVTLTGATGLIGHRLGRSPWFIAVATNFGIGAHKHRNRSTVGKWLALRPEFSAQARMPPTARPEPRGVRRGLLVLTAGPVPYSYGRCPTGPVVASQSD